MKGNIFSPEDREFMELVHSDLLRYLQRNIFPSRTVLVFPPFNGFRRFLIHKLIEDNFASSEVAAFSIGEDIGRRIVICYKGLISEAANKGLPATIPQPPNSNMIDKEKSNRQRQTPTAAVYRPPAARLAESRKSTDNLKVADTKQTRVRRPDQQMYVPRPKRASYGNDLPRSRSRSNSRLSLDSDQSLDLTRNSSVNSEESMAPSQSDASKECNDESIMSLPSSVESEANKPQNSSIYNNRVIKILNEENMNTNKNSEMADSNNAITNVMESAIHFPTSDEISKPESEEARTVDESVCQETVTVNIMKNIESKNKNETFDSQELCSVEQQNNKLIIEKIGHSSCQPKINIDNIKENISSKSNSIPNEIIEIISLSSDSKSEDSSSSFMSSIDSKTNDSSANSEVENKSSEKMDIDYFEGKNCASKSKNRFPHKGETSKNKVQPSITKMPEVLVISDSSSSYDKMESADNEIKEKNNGEKSKNQQSHKVLNVKIESSSMQNKSIDPSECDWEALYDDSGECLVPSLMEQLADSVGKVRVTSADNDYRPYQSIEERTNDGECVIEIYDFPAEFKTTDLFNVFAAYRNKNFQIKWVDDTHALGIFPSPLMADEVLACTLPFVKTRPLRLGIVESRHKARNLVLPPLPSVERPKTCTALARRLVTGALGIRIPTSSQEREKEKQVLKEAREKRRMEAKQKEAAWDGTITSDSVM